MYYSIYPSPLPESQSLRVQKHLIFKGGMCVPLSLVMCLQKESLTTIWDSVYRKCLPRVCFLLSKWIPQKSNEKNCLNKRRNIKMLIQGKIEQLWKLFLFFLFHSFSIISFLILLILLYSANFCFKSHLLLREFKESMWSTILIKRQALILVLLLQSPSSLKLKS